MPLGFAEERTTEIEILQKRSLYRGSTYPVRPASGPKVELFSKKQGSVSLDAVGTWKAISSSGTDQLGDILDTDVGKICDSGLLKWQVSLQRKNEMLVKCPICLLRLG